MSAPENEVPAGLPFSAVVGRTDEMAVLVNGFRVYSTGVDFNLSLRLRTEPRHDLGYRIHELILGHGPGDPDGNLDERLLLGVEYADGRTVTNVRSDWAPRFEPGATEADEPILSVGGGGGGGRSFDHHFWLSPLPPAGPLIFVCRWPAFGIAETQTELDASAIVAARDRVQSLWPWEPAVHDASEREPVELQLPTSGWFAGALRRPRDR
jgi:hypothetical protein